MNKDNQTTVNEYRKKHKRCKTCVHAKQCNAGWYCWAKGSWHAGQPDGIQGCFCKLYKAREYKV